MNKSDSAVPAGSVAIVQPGRWQRGPAEEAWCCVDLESFVPRSTGRPLPGSRFPPEVITVAVRWYLRSGLSWSRSISPGHLSTYRRLLEERGFTVTRTATQDRATLLPGTFVMDGVRCSMWWSRRGSGRPPKQRTSNPLVA